MGFWENVNEELKKAVGEGWTTVKDNARIGKLRLKVNSLHKKADKHFSEIGGKVYEMCGRSGAQKPNPLESPEITGLIEKINRIEAETLDIEAEIARIRHKEEGAAKPSGKAGKETAEQAGEGEEKEAEKRGETD